MAETITRVDYFYIETPNKPGEAARALNAIKESGLNLLAFSGFPKGRRAQLDFIPADSAAFAKCAKKAGCTLSKKKSGFLIQGEDRIAPSRPADEAGRCKDQRYLRYGRLCRRESIRCHPLGQSAGPQTRDKGSRRRLRLYASRKENSMRLTGERIAILMESMYQDMDLWRFLTVPFSLAMMFSVSVLHVN